MYVFEGTYPWNHICLAACLRAPTPLPAGYHHLIAAPTHGRRNLGVRDRPQPTGRPCELGRQPTGRRRAHTRSLGSAFWCGPFVPLPLKICSSVCSVDTRRKDGPAELKVEADTETFRSIPKRRREPRGAGPRGAMRGVLCCARPCARSSACGQWWRARARCLCVVRAERERGGRNHGSCVGPGCTSCRCGNTPGSRGSSLLVSRPPPSPPARFDAGDQGCLGSCGAWTLRVFQSRTRSLACCSTSTLQTSPVGAPVVPHGFQPPPIALYHLRAKPLRRAMELPVAAMQRYCCLCRLLLKCFLSTT